MWGHVKYNNYIRPDQRAGIPYQNLINLKRDWIKLITEFFTKMLSWKLFVIFVTNTDPWTYPSTGNTRPQGCTHPLWTYTSPEHTQALEWTWDQRYTLKRTWHQRYSFPCGQTNTSENITFLQIHWRAVNNTKNVNLMCSWKIDRIQMFEKRTLSTVTVGSSYLQMHELTKGWNKNDKA